MSRSEFNAMEEDKRARLKKEVGLDVLMLY